MGDLIDRQAAIDATNRTDYRGLAVEDVKKVTDEVVKELKQLPSEQPEITLESAIYYLHRIGWMQKHDRILTESAQQQREKGKWLVDEDGNTECPFCGNTCGFGNYCNECGADLRGENDV